MPRDLTASLLNASTRDALQYCLDRKQEQLSALRSTIACEEAELRRARNSLAECEEYIADIRHTLSH